MESVSVQTVGELIDGDSVTPATRRVLRERLEFDRDYAARFFDANEFETLTALCDALAPSKVVPCEFVAGEIDRRLFANTGNGWRYAEMPPDAEMHRRALPLFDRFAQKFFARDFARVTAAQRVEIVRKMRDGQNAELTNEFPSARFFEEIFAEFVELFYSHPLCLAEIGYIGFADARGW